jgi:hypothetical protein
VHIQNIQALRTFTKKLRHFRKVKKALIIFPRSASKDAKEIPVMMREFRRGVEQDDKRIAGWDTRKK